MEQGKVNLLKKISVELSLQEFQVTNVVKLLFEEECTIPFVARYRKEMTQSMDEVAIRDIRDRYLYLTDLESTKGKYWKIIEAQAKEKPEIAAKLPDLRQRFKACETKQELEDLYLPYKPKRRTKAMIAREKGLEPLLEKILEGRETITDLMSVAAAFVTPADAQVEAGQKVDSPAAALDGAADILAERVNENADCRAFVRQVSIDTGMLVSKKVESDDEAPATGDTPAARPNVGEAGSKKSDASKYINYFDYKEPVSTAAGHRIMAVRRGEAEKILKLSVEVDTAKILDGLHQLVVGGGKVTVAVRQWMEGTIDGSYKRLLGPSIETEVRLLLKTRGEEEAIQVFARNLSSLLMLPPIPGKVVLGVDPGFRTGSKLAVISDTGKLMEYATIYPELGERATEGPKTRAAKEEVVRLVRKHNVGVVAVGNGTGSREVDALITAALRDAKLTGIKRLVVNEAGASVYSTEEIAREEFPDLDPTIRSAVSIGRRLQDPLAELVKINPRSIGVGQYQHDINPSKLSSSLNEVVESCVNKVGVNLNTASYALLSYVSGIGPALAKGIVSFRDKSGKFGSRADIMRVPGFGPKAFEQAAGFLRIPEGGNPLDNSAVHPERYEIVEKMAADVRKPLTEIIGHKTIVDTLPLEKYVTATVGMITLKDIAAELIKPGRDPREDGARLLFSDDVSTLEDLKIDMTLQGTVTNVTNFGAFVDIGVHQDGLIHISELSDKFVKDPAEVVKVGDVLKVRVLDVDLKRRRISLSAKTSRPGGDAARPVSGPSQGQGNRPAPAKRPEAKPRQDERSVTLDDLMKKWGG